ncbi:DUF488 domain-containing protein [Nocardiopsis composta]|uniref:Uncharacterized protein YeaO (DUF488 family) n=1 Tax=Nocardiopsis composta TaxID=157465 RepID=A0A7W8VDD0_9ACTN|nr:DUF488 family protein [Nocardiopsis composta]MBB5431890.1 uncharacterized protein YeaO (DUF488 family) [Nocardiopsis composta]
MSGDIVLMRVHDALAEPPERGKVFLVDRLWPRGVRKEALRLDGWLKDAAPSTGLRRWFGHDPARWAEFAERYRRELADRPEALRPVLDALAEGPVVLLYAARDTEHNQAVVLRGVLEGARGR